jgi:hypothetical protein
VRGRKEARRTEGRPRHCVWGKRGRRSTSGKRRFATVEAIFFVRGVGGMGRRGLEEGRGQETERDGAWCSGN